MSKNDTFIPDFDLEYDRDLTLTLDVIEQLPDCLCVYLKGIIDNRNSNFFQKKLNMIFLSRYKNIIFNCATLEYISSTGIGLFASYFSKFTESGGQIVFLDIQPKIKEVFSLLGFSHYFVIRHSLEDVIKSFEDTKVLVDTVFPRNVQCPVCEVQLRSLHAGKFRCSKCKTIINVTEQGKVTL